MNAARKLTSLFVENFKKLIFIDITLGDHVTEISGDNEMGKSSAIDAVKVLFEGLAVAPPVPIRRGADQCTIRGKLGDLIVERTFRNGSDGKVVSSFTLRTPDGAKFPSPQRHLDEIIGSHMLDPLDFINAEPKRQFDVLRQFVPDIDFEAIDRANLGDYDRRTEVNRFAKEARAAASLIVVPQNTPDEPVDDSALVDELQKANDHNALVERRRLNREQHLQKIDDAKRGAALLREQGADLRRQAQELENRACAKDEEAYDMQQQYDEAEPLPAAIDVTEIRTRIAGAKDINAAVQKRTEKVRHEHIAIKYERESKELSERIDNRNAQKRNTIAQAKIPVQGLGFAEGRVTLNDLPFEQASTAEKLRTAFALIVALNPKVRLAWIRDASLLDEKSTAVIEQLAREYDCQVLLETVRPNSANAIVLEDGHVKGVEPPQKQVMTQAEARKELNDEFALTAPEQAKKQPRRKWQGPGAPTGEPQ